MKLKPTGDRVALKLVERKKVTEGGIHIPPKAEEKPTEGEVVAVGPGVKLDDGSHYPLDVSVGDRVIFKKYSTTRTDATGEAVHIVQQKHILCVLEDAAA